MSQLSLFSADLTPPVRDDLGGLLASHGQISRGPEGSRLSILLGDHWRAKSLARELQVRDLLPEILPAPGGGHTEVGEPVPTEEPMTFSPRTAHSHSLDRIGESPVLLRTDRSVELDAVAISWTKGAVKAVPSGLVATAGLLRCWAIAAGYDDASSGFMLGFDPHAPDTYEPLAAVLARAGLAGLTVGVRGGGPGIRILGHRRRTRLVELIGSPPPEAPHGAFPLPEH